MFDPYRKWLGIPEDQRPPNHYQLLGIATDEQDPEVIEAAAVRQSAFVRNFQSGKYGAEATRILTEIAAARLCLLDPAKRSRYDAELNPRRSGPQLGSPRGNSPRRPASGGPEPDLRLVPLDDEASQSTTAAKTPGQSQAPAIERATKRPAAPASQSSASHRDLAPAASSAPSRTPPAAHRTPPPASVPPPVNLADLVPQRSAPRPARTARLGPSRPTNYVTPRSPIGLVWQIPLVIVVFVALVLLANALGRRMAASRRPAAPAAVESTTSSRRMAFQAVFAVVDRLEGHPTFAQSIRARLAQHYRPPRPA